MLSQIGTIHSKAQENKKYTCRILSRKPQSTPHIHITEMVQGQKKNNTWDVFGLFTGNLLQKRSGQRLITMT